jgi:putative transcriptional regulator
MIAARRSGLATSLILFLSGFAGAQALGPAAGRFLLARPELPDPNFNDTIVLIVDYGVNEGAFGLIVNRPTDVPVSRVFPEAARPGRSTSRLHFGGPVSGEVMLVLFVAPGEVEGAARVFDDVFLSGDRDLVINSAAAGDTFRVYSGYSGWAPGQLEAEMARGDWIVIPAEREVVFSLVPQEEWQRLFDRVNRRFIFRGFGVPLWMPAVAWASGQGGGGGQAR